MAHPLRLPAALALAVLPILLLTTGLNAQPQEEAGSRLLFRSADGGFEVRGELSLEPIFENGAISAVTATIPDLDLSLDSLAATGSLTATVVPAEQGWIIEQAVVDARDIRLLLGDKSIDVGGASFRAAGEYAGRTIRLSRMQVDLGDFFSASGEATLVGATPTRFALAGEVHDAERLLGLVRQFVPDLPRIALRGRLPFAASLPRGGEALAFRLSPRGLDVSLPTYGITAQLASGNAALTVPLEEQDWSASLDLAGDVELATPSLTLPGSSLALAMRPDGNGVEVDLESVAAPSPRLGVGEKTVDLPAVSIAGPFVFAGDTVRARGVAVDLKGVGTIGLRGAFGSFDSQGLRVTGEDLSLAGFAPLAEDLTGLKITEWSPGGAAALEITTSDGIYGEFAIRDAAMASPDGRIFLDKGELDITVQHSTPQAPVLIELAVRQAQALYDAWYVDFAAHPFVADARIPPAENGRYADVELGATWEGFAAIDATADVDPQRESASGRIRLTRSDLEAIFNTFVRDPNALTLPRLQAAVVQGEALFDSAFRYAEGVLDLDGDFSLPEGRFGLPEEKMMLEKLRIELPVRYTFWGEPAEESPRWGSIGADTVLLPTGRAEDLTMQATLWANTLRIPTPVKVPLFGGHASTSAIKVEQALSPQRTGTAKVRLRDIDLAQLGIEAVPLQGTIGTPPGSPLEVNAVRKAIVLDGAITGEFYEGSLKIDNMALLEPLTSGRQMLASLTVDALDLEPFSQALDVGRIEGFVDIDLTGLTIAYGQPATFTLSVISTEEKLTDRTISLKAVNSLSTIGTGSGLQGAGISFFSSIFEEFSYATIGFTCTLENDIFTVHGLVAEDGVEYLIKRPAFRGINIVNSNPNNRISFSDMLGRLERVLKQSPKQNKETAS